METKDGLHVWEDHFYPEVVDPVTGEVLPDGEKGELVFTSLTKQAMPVIRYRTRDLTRLLPGTARTMRRMEKVTGRTDDMIILRGVNLFPTQVEEIVLRTDGLSEVMGPGVSQECVESKDGLHIWEDHFYPEVVDPLDGVPLRDGEEGELLFTSLTKEALPIIRYRTRDLTRLSPGSARPGMRRMQKITGRSDDMIILRGVNVFPTQIEEIVLRTEGLSPHFQLVLSTEGRMDALTVRVEARPDTPTDRRCPAAAELVATVKQRVGVSVGCEVVDPETLERSVGKLKRLKDLRGR